MAIRPLPVQFWYQHASDRLLYNLFCCDLLCFNGTLRSFLTYWTSLLDALPVSSAYRSSVVPIIEQLSYATHIDAAPIQLSAFCCLLGFIACVISTAWSLVDPASCHSPPASMRTPLLRLVSAHAASTSALLVRYAPSGSDSIPPAPCDSRRERSRALASPPSAMSAAPLPRSRRRTSVR